MLAQTSDSQFLKPMSNASTSKVEFPKSDQQQNSPTTILRKKYRTRTDQDEAKLITAKIKRLEGQEKDRFFDAVCQMGRANPFHFNTMIASKTHPRDGANLLKRMERMTIAPDVVTYTSLIDMEVRSKLYCPVVS